MQTFAFQSHHTPEFHQTQALQGMHEPLTLSFKRIFILFD